MSFKKQDFAFISRASLAAFGAYFCMYAFRKPFAVATFENLSVLGIDYKILLLIAQVLGYMLSKFIGIKVISELKSKQRLVYLLVLIGVSEVALLVFGFVPQPYNIIFMFLNGLPLGMIWGIVFSYLEGRKYTEILGVILCTSFIVSSGVVKSIGLLVMSFWGVSQDNYARELWDGLGYAGDIAVYSTSELVVALLVLVILASVYAIKDNLKALLTYHGILLIGTFSVGIATFLLQAQILGPFYWMVISGFGLYICYVPFNALFFDRFIAAFRIKGNAGFLIYLADAFGYMGSMGVLLYKNFGMNAISWLQFFINGAYLLSVLGTCSVIISYFYLKNKHRNANLNVLTYEN